MYRSSTAGARRAFEKILAYADSQYVSLEHAYSILQLQRQEPKAFQGNLRKMVCSDFAKTLQQRFLTQILCLIARYKEHNTGVAKLAQNVRACEHLRGLLAKARKKN